MVSGSLIDLRLRLTLIWGWGGAAVVWLSSRHAVVILVVWGSFRDRTVQGFADRISIQHSLGPLFVSSQRSSKGHRRVRAAQNSYTRSSIMPLLRAFIDFI